MTMLPADGSCATESHSLQSVSGLEKSLRSLSVFTMVMTVPQVLTIACIGWILLDAAVVSGVILHR
jgi:hypothetical protein